MDVDQVTDKIVVGGLCMDSAICGSMTNNNQNPLIELIDPLTLNHLWSTYLSYSSGCNCDYEYIQSVKFKPDGTEIAAMVNIDWNENQHMMFLLFNTGDGTLRRSLRHSTWNSWGTVWPDSLLFDASNMVIASITYDNHWYVIKLELKDVSSMAQVQAPWILYTGHGSYSISEARGYSLIFDKAASPTGYYASGRISFSGSDDKGFIIFYIKHDGTINYQIDPSGDFSHKIRHLALSTDNNFLWGCGIGDDNGDRAQYMMFKVTGGNAPNQFKAWAQKNSDLGCEAISADNGIIGYSIVHDTDPLQAIQLSKIVHGTSSINIYRYIISFPQASTVLQSSTFQDANVFFVGQLIQFTGMAGTTVPLTHGAGYVMKILKTDNAVHQIDTCIGQQIIYDTTADQYSFSTSSMTMTERTSNYRLIKRSDTVKFDVATISFSTLVSTHVNVLRLDCLTQTLAPPPVLVYDVPFPTGPTAYPFINDFSVGVCSALGKTGYDAFTLSPLTPNPIAQTVPELDYNWLAANHQTVPQKYQVTVTQNFLNGAIVQKIMQTLTVDIQNTCRDKAIPNLALVPYSYSIASPQVTTVSYGAFLPSKAGCQMTYSLWFKNGTQVPPGNCLFSLDIVNSKVLIGQCSDIALVSSTAIELYVMAELIDRPSTATGATDQRGFQNFAITIKGPCFPTAVAGSGAVTPIIQYVLMSPAASYSIVTPLFSFTNYPTTIPSLVCETYSLKDSAGTAAPTQTYITLNSLVNPQVVNIGVSTTPGEIGTLDIKLITLKILSTITENGKTALVSLPITLKHECTNVELTGNPDITYDYQYLKDGTKPYTLQSFTPGKVIATDPDPPASVNCFLYSLAESATDVALANPEVKMTTYPTLTVGPAAGNQIGTQPFQIVSFRVRGIVNVQNRSPRFQIINLKMIHECTGTSLSVADSFKVFNYNYVLKDPDMLISVTAVDPYLIQNNVDATLTAANINCFEYFLYEQDPVAVWPQTPAVLPSFMLYTYPTITLTSPGANTISTPTWSKQYWLGGRVKIDNLIPVSKPFTVNIVHECIRAHINTVISPSFPVDYIDNSVSTTLPSFNLFTTTEVAGTTCILYEWSIYDINTNSYVLADSVNAPVIQTLGYPDLVTAATYSQAVLETEKFRILNMRITAYNKLDPLNKTAYSNVPLTVYHKCYYMPLDQNMAGMYKEYPLKTSSDILNIPRFAADTSCKVNLTFKFVNVTTDKQTGITTTTITPLIFPNPYLDFDYDSYQFFVKGHMQAVDFIGDHRILMEAKMGFGVSTSSQWINITINCAMESLGPNEGDLQDIKNKIMKLSQYTIGDSKLRIPFREFVPQPAPLYCGIPISYHFKLQSGDPLPNFLTAGNFIFTKGGYVDVWATTRKIVPDIRWTILITGEVPQDNPPLGNFLISTMVLPLEIIIPNIGPPTFKSNPRDVRVQVNQVGVIKFTSMEDPDWEDVASMQSIDFGDAFSFIQGQFPQYKVIPRNNETDPGSYEINIVITDDNPNPQSSTYSFKVYIDPLPPALINIQAGINNKNTTRKAKPGAAKLETKLKSISNFGLATVTFSQDMRIPANISSIDSKVMAIRVLPGLESDPKFLKIIKWKVKSKSFQSQFSQNLQESPWKSNLILKILQEYLYQALYKLIFLINIDA